MDLIEYLRRRIPAEELARLRAEVEGPGEVDYDAVARRVVSRLKGDEELFAWARSRLELSDRDLLELPQGRRTTVLRNSSPVVLLVLFRDLIRQSWRERLVDLARSLRLAEVALEVVFAVARSRYLAP